MSYHRRRLPHYHPPEAILFLTWRLFDSLPINATSQPEAGRAFVHADRLLDRKSHGPLWLKDPEIANLVAETLLRGHREYRLYDLLAWVVMPNHVHVVLQPFGDLSAITRWIKGSTARSANLRLGRTGSTILAIRIIRPLHSLHRGTEPRYPIRRKTIPSRPA
jgi:hypothetical protein